MTRVRWARYIDHDTHPFIGQCTAIRVAWKHLETKSRGVFDQMCLHLRATGARSGSCSSLSVCSMVQPCALQMGSLSICLHAPWSRNVQSVPKAQMQLQSTERFIMGVDSLEQIGPITCAFVGSLGFQDLSRPSRGRTQPMVAAEFPAGMSGPPIVCERSIGLRQTSWMSASPQVQALMCAPLSRESLSHRTQ